MSTGTNRRRNSGEVGLGQARSRISAELAAVIAAGAGAVGSFGVVISGIWMIHLAVN